MTVNRKMSTAVVVVLCCLIAGAAQAATYTSKANGNWNAAGTWDWDEPGEPVSGPGAGDNVIIAAGHTVTITAAAEAASIEILATGTLTTSGNHNLTVSGGLTNYGTINRSFYQGTWTIGSIAGDFANYGSYSHTSGGSLVIENGSFTHSGTQWNSSNVGSIILNSATSGTFSFTANMGHAGPITVGSGDLVISNGLILSRFNFSAENLISIPNGDFIVEAGGNYTNNGTGGAITCRNLRNYGTFLSSSTRDITTTATTGQSFAFTTNMTHRGGVVVSSGDFVVSDELAYTRSYPEGTITVEEGDFIIENGGSFNATGNSGGISIEKGDFINHGNYSHTGNGNLVIREGDFTNSATGSFNNGTNVGAEIQVAGNFINLQANPDDFRVSSTWLTFIGSLESRLNNLSGSPIVFGRVSMEKDGSGDVAILESNLSVDRNTSGALTINSGKLVTNGKNLTVNGGTSSTVTGNTNGVLSITGNSTVLIRTLNQNANPSLGRVEVGPNSGDDPVVRITNQHHISTRYNRVFQLSGGTINYENTGSTTSSALRLYGYGSDDGGWFADGGAANFYGSIHYQPSGTSYGTFRAQSPATVRFVGPTAAAVSLVGLNVAAPATLVWEFGDLVIEKDGVNVTFSTAQTTTNWAGIVEANSVTLNSGNLLLGGRFTTGPGYEFGDVTINSRLELSLTGTNVINNDLSVAGNWTVGASGEFIHNNKSVRFVGENPAVISAGTEANRGFYDLTAMKTDGTVGLDSDLLVQNQLVVSSGGFAVNDNLLRLGTVAASGTVEVNGGVFSAVGTVPDAAQVSAADAGRPYAFAVNSGGTIAARNAVFERMDADGIHIKAEATVDPTDNFSESRFAQGSASGPLLRIENTDDITMTNTSFEGTPAPPGPPWSIQKTTAGTGVVRVLSGEGDLWGEDYDNDPNDLVVWGSDDEPEPAAFALLAPTGTDISVTPTFTWESADPGEGTVTYDLYLVGEGENPREAAEPTVSGLEEPTWSPAEPLAYNTSYNWDVLATLSIDENPKWSNESFSFTTGDEPEPVPGGWLEMALLPSIPGNRRDAVGRGSWLAYDAASDLIYAAKGQRNHEVYVFNPAAGENGEWLTEPLAEIPMDTIRPRPVDRGGRGVVVDGYLYVIHGNNTSLFWRLPLGGNGTAEENPWTPWERLEDVPLENSGRPVRGGGDLVYDATENAIYLLKGDRTDFLSYDIGSGEWTVLANAPADPPRWLRDSWLAVDETGTIYAHKARYFDRTEENRNLWAHYMYTFDGTWSEEMTGMPLLGPVGRRLRRRRAGEGSSGTFQGGNLYALKGGNTQQLWQYDIAGEAWEHLDEMPLVGEDGRRRINAGGYLISAGEGTLYALKGNRSNQFWRYTLPTTGMVASAPRPDRSGVMSDELPTGQASVRIGPNPLNGGFATLRYNLPQAGPAQVNVFDVTGRNVLSRNIAASQTGSVSLDLRSLSAGIYLLQVEAEGFNGSQKLVVQR